MSSPKIPDSNLHEQVSDTFFRKPQTPAKAGKEPAVGESKKGKGSQPEIPLKSPEEDTGAEKPKNIKKKKVTRRPLMTYFAEENYDAFEEMYIEIKRRVRQDTGKKLAETHVTETAIMLAVEEYNRDPETFIARFKERIEN